MLHHGMSVPKRRRKSLSSDIWLSNQISGNLSSWLQMQTLLPEITSNISSIDLASVCRANRGNTPIARQCHREAFWGPLANQRLPNLTVADLVGAQAPIGRVFAETADIGLEMRTLLQSVSSVSLMVVVAPPGPQLDLGEAMWYPQQIMSVYHLANGDYLVTLDRQQGQPRSISRDVVGDDGLIEAIIHQCLNGYIDQVWSYPSDDADGVMDAVRRSYLDSVSSRPRGD